MKMRRVGNYGPRCSLRFKDRYAEMMAPDYESPAFGRLWTEMRDRHLAAAAAPNPYRHLLPPPDAV